MKIYPITRWFALVLVLTLGAAAGCIRSGPEEVAARGDVLTIVVSEAKEMGEVVYTVGEQSFAIAPLGEGMTLALVKVRVINPKSTRVTLTLDEEAVFLIGTGEEEFHPLNPGLRAVESSALAPKGNPYSSHLWGQIQVLQGYEVTGWFFFEVPVGSKFAAFAWEDVETIMVYYSP
ncbi:MAG: hypothetical protein HW388_899 [Dehalococcoidia bacterium]|nr:hypothetical protein [Dehalococcoidia bacterium]